jgi:hypothetical protein
MKTITYSEIAVREPIRLELERMRIEPIEVQGVNMPIEGKLGTENLEFISTNIALIIRLVLGAVIDLRGVKITWWQLLKRLNTLVPVVTNIYDLFVAIMPFWGLAWEEIKDAKASKKQLEEIAAAYGKIVEAVNQRTLELA